ncbi:TPA: hypothetical protein DF272_02960 [Candidatus Falkowbacteria bacterium]|nr:hypothetical protein [Candidatus Falkowbacteria bacterium]
MKTVGTLLVALMISLFFGGAAEAETLTVGYTTYTPFVIEDKSGRLTGYDIDLLEQLGNYLGVDFEYVRVDRDKRFDRLISGEFDMMIGGVSVTNGREQRFDFSYPYFNAGLTVMVRNEKSPVLNWDVGRLVMYFVLYVIFMAHVFYLTEKRHQANMGSYLRGTYESSYFVLVTSATVGYGDITPKTAFGKFCTIIMMITGIAFFTIMVGQITSNIINSDINTTIHSAADLKDQKIATLAGTTSEAALQKYGADLVLVQEEADAFDLLATMQVDGVVFDAPGLLYKEMNDKTGRFATLHFIFDKQYYGLALKDESPFTEDINRALLLMEENGITGGLNQKWFGRSEL